MTPPADTILLARDVLTMDPAHPRAQSIAIRNGRILAVGSGDAVREHETAATEVIDLQDRCVLPGLVEPHTHPDLCAQCYAWVDVSGFTHRNVDGVERALRSAVAERAPGEWIFAFGLDPMLTEDIGVWGRDRLDAIAPQHPVAVMIQSMHTVFVNSAALAASGIDETTPDPPGGGRFQRDAEGRLTGKLEEAAAFLPIARFDRTDEATLRERMWQQYRRYARAGLTTIGIPGLFTPLSMLGLFEEFSRSDDVPIRTVAYLRHHQVGEVKWRPGDGDDHFRVQGVKLWYDGSPYSGTMLLDEPYLESRLCCCTLGIVRGTTGHANFDPDEMRALLARLHGDGWQVLTHAQGDRGTREIMDMYEEALSAHSRLLRDHIIGPGRAERLMPVGSALARGHRVSLHADSPMYPPEPLRLVRTAVTRRSRLGERIAPAEAISTEQALRAVTIDAAWQLFADDRIGSLEPGKHADLSVLERNPLETAPDDLDRIEVTETWLGGRPVLSA